MNALFHALSGNRPLFFPHFINRQYDFYVFDAIVEDHKIYFVSIWNRINNRQSNILQVFIDKSLKGWKEVEYEVVRDAYNNCITVRKSNLCVKI